MTRMKLISEDADAWNKKGVAFRIQGKYDEAIQAYSEAIRLDPENADVWYNKALIYRAMGLHPEADAALARAEDIRTGR